MLETFNGYPVNVDEFNTDGERFIVLLHGFGASTFSWRTVTQELSKLGHVFAYDRPGFGFTPVVARSKHEDPYSLAGQVELLASIIETKSKGRPVIVVGHSAGALVATEFVLRNPSVVSALVLESPAVWRKPPVPGWLGKTLRTPRLEKRGEKLLEGFATSGMRILTTSFYDTEKLTDEVVAGYTAPMQNNSWKASLWRFMTASQRNQVRDNLWRIDIPTFVITGDHDKIVKVEDTFKVAERILGHSIYLVPNSGHLAHEETPEDFLRVTKRFIEKNT
jgi:pimeloyl-ACP methyl ester carboxylesterase